MKYQISSTHGWKVKVSDRITLWQTGQKQYAPTIFNLGGIKKQYGFTLKKTLHVKAGKEWAESIFDTSNKITFIS